MLLHKRYVYRSSPTRHNSQNNTYIYIFTASTPLRKDTGVFYFLGRFITALLDKMVTTTLYICDFAVGTMVSTLPLAQWLALCRWHNGYHSAVGTMVSTLPLAQWLALCRWHNG